MQFNNIKMKKYIIYKINITNLIIFVLFYFININNSLSIELINNNKYNSNLKYIQPNNIFSNDLNFNTQFEDYNFNIKFEENINEKIDSNLENQNLGQDTNQISNNINNGNNNTSDKITEFKRFSQEDFKYGNTPKFTITGNLPYEETHLNLLNTGLVFGGVTTLFVLQHIAQANTIWKNKSDFKILEDGSYAIYADKPGHVIGTYLASYAMTEALMTSGVDWESSVVTGGLLGFAYNTYVEVLDGYGANFGFSPTDMYANAFGAGLYIAQFYSPFLQNVTPKFTYFPANWHGQKKRQPHDFFIDDYSSHTLWLSFNVHNLLPDNYKEYWPSWLELSLGYAARNLTVAYDPDNIYSHDPNATFRNNDVEGDPKFIIALDYNLVKLLPDGGSFWNWAKQTLNYFKLPAPAIEIGINGKTKFFLIYPFPIN